MPSLPFVHLNLRRNPFGEPPPEERAALFVGVLLDWHTYLSPSGRGEALDSGGSGARSEPRRFLQLLGPSGCGKSTCLYALRERFPGSAMIQWCPVEGWPEIRAQTGGPLFVDDAQELRQRLLARVLEVPIVAVATQKDLAASFEKAGFSVMTVRVQEWMSFPLLKEMVGRRLEWARRGPGPLPRVDEGVLAALIRRHGPDVGAIQADLYDRYQGLEAEE